MKLTADRLNRISPSRPWSSPPRRARFKAAGRDVISLSAGEPDFDTPRNVKDAAIRAIEAGETKYTDVAGTPALRKAVAEKFRRDSGIDYKPEEIIVSTGGKQVIFNAMLATLNAGDEVIIPSPVLGQLSRHRRRWPTASPCWCRAGRTHGFKLRAEDLEAAITPQHQMVHAEQSVQPDRRRLLRRGAAADLRRAAAPSGCLDLHRRHLREARL